MKFFASARLLGLAWVIVGVAARAQIPSAPKTEPTTTAPSVVASMDAMEDEFLAQIEKTSDVEPVFDDYEKKIMALIQQYPGERQPFVGLTELFEKCETSRTARLIESVLSRTDLPEKIRPFYEDLRKKEQLIGTPMNQTFTAVDGRTVRFADLRGKVVLIDFWATWCGPCVRDLPKLQALYAKSHRDGLEVIGVSFDRERSKLDSFLQTRAIPWRQIYADAATQKTFSTELGVTGGYLPTVFLIGRDGKIRSTLNSRFRLEDKVAVLLAEQ